ncbi:MAG TPA: hypothetical protein VGW34_05190 [Allosphingosinicella sp.]|nr:hypothetical protein [Allosphingosinicella sp.]
MLENGTEGDDLFIGGDEDDWYQALGGDDELRGNGGEDQLNGQNGDDLIFGGESGDSLFGEQGKDELHGEEGADVLDGGEMDDALFGGAGNDHLDGEGGLDWLSGGDGNDYLVGGLGSSDGADQLFGGTGIDQLQGGLGSDVLHGEAGNDQLYGMGGNDDLLGGAGNDYLSGGEGADRFDGGDDDGLDWGGFLSLFGDRVNFGGLRATAAVVVDLRTGVIADDGFGNRETMTGIETIGGGSVFADQFYGNDQANHIYVGADAIVMGFGGNDFFSFSGAAATIDGGAGSDTLLQMYGSKMAPGANPGEPARMVYTENGVVIDLLAGTVTDGFGGTGSIVNVENIGGSAHPAGDVLLGDNRDNVIRGLGGADRIEGRGGNDTISYSDPSGMHYGYHDRSYGAVMVDLAAGYAEETALKSGTVAADSPGFGRDTLLDIENIIGTGLGDRLCGDLRNNLIAPDAGNDFVDGRQGTDTVSYDGARGAVTIDLAAGIARQQGSGAPPQWFPSGMWESVMVEADDAAPSRDRLLNIENAIGSSLDDRLSGNAASNRLDGGAGRDLLAWSGGSDTLIGGAGSDTADYSAAAASVRIDLTAGTGSLTGVAGTDRLFSLENAIGTAQADHLIGNRAANRLDGGDGIDRLEGGAGNDVYVVDDRRDAVVELSGIDRVEASVSLVLAAGVEQLTLVGAANLAGTGNAAANRLNGNDGANRLDGLGGADVMAGGAGNDVYRVDHASDLITEAAVAGTDRVEASVSFTLGRNLEALSLIGAADIDGAGNALANRITGNGGANVLAGGRGADRLEGGAGRDSFLFDALLRRGEADALLDFAAADDRIVLDSSIFSALAEGRLPAAAFRAGTAAADSTDRIVYDGATGNLFYDADGTGDAAAVLFAKVTPGTELTAADFIVVA